MNVAKTLNDNDKLSCESASLEEIENSLLPYYAETSKAANKVGSFLGLEFAFEIRRPSAYKGTDRFWCAICEEEGVLEHLNYLRHDLNYLKKVFPSLHAIITQGKSSAPGGENKKGVIQKSLSKILDAVGYPQLAVVDIKDKAKACELFRACVKAISQLSYYDAIKPAEPVQSSESTPKVDAVKSSIQIQNSKEISSEKKVAIASSNILMVGGFRLQFEGICIDSAKVTYSYSQDWRNFRQSIMNLGAKQDLSNYDLVIISPFDWLVLRPQLVFGLVRLKKEESRLNFELNEEDTKWLEGAKSELEEMKKCFLEDVKKLSETLAKKYPKLKVIWLLPYPSIYLLPKAHAEREAEMSKTILQYSHIKDIFRSWVETMPELPVISMLDMLISKEQQDSFENGKYEFNLNLDEAGCVVGIKPFYGIKLSVGFRQKIWDEVNEVYALLKENPNEIKCRNILKRKDLCLDDVFVEDQKNHKKFFNEEYIKFQKSKSAILKKGRLCPKLYDYRLEWAYQWRNTFKHKVGQASPATTPPVNTSIVNNITKIKASGEKKGRVPIVLDFSTTTGSSKKKIDATVEPSINKIDVMVPSEMKNDATVLPSDKQIVVMGPSVKKIDAVVLPSTKRIEVTAPFVKKVEDVVPSAKKIDSLKLDAELNSSKIISVLSPKTQTVLVGNHLIDNAGGSKNAVRFCQYIKDRTFDWISTRSEVFPKQRPNTDFLILSPFDWLVTKDSYKFLGIDNETSEQNKDKEIKITFNKLVATTLNQIKLIQMKYAKECPKIKLIYLLPFPLDFTKQFDISSTKKKVLKSIIQYCYIKEIHKRLISLIPEIAVISLLDILVTREQQESFVDGSLELKWDKNMTCSSLNKDLHLKFREKIWEEIRRVQLMLLNSPEEIKKENGSMLKMLSEVDAHIGVPVPEKKAYFAEFFKFRDTKSKVLYEEKLNPFHYDFSFEWAYHWFKNRTPPRSFIPTIALETNKGLSNSATPVQDASLVKSVKDRLTLTPELTKPTQESPVRQRIMAPTKESAESTSTPAKSSIVPDTKLDLGKLQDSVSSLGDSVEEITPRKKLSIKRTFDSANVDAAKVVTVPEVNEVKTGLPLSFNTSKIQIIGGHFLLKQKLPNQKLELIVDKTFDWVMTKAISHSLSEVDILIISPFDWVVSEECEKFLGLDKAKNDKEVDKELIRSLSLRITSILKEVNKLVSLWQNKYPNLKVIWMLPCPLNYTKSSLREKGSYKRKVYKSVIQFCYIKDILKRWIEMMPQVPVISLIDIVANERQQESFVDMSFQLRWNWSFPISTLGQPLSFGFNDKIWENINIMFDTLINNPEQIMQTNVSLKDELVSMTEISKSIRGLQKSSYYAEYLNFRDEKSADLVAHDLNPAHYIFIWEWAYYWRKKQNIPSKPVTLIKVDTKLQKPVKEEVVSPAIVEKKQHVSILSSKPVSSIKTEVQKPVKEEIVSSPALKPEPKQLNPYFSSIRISVVGGHIFGSPNPTSQPKFRLVRDNHFNWLKTRHLNAKLFPTFSDVDLVVISPFDWIINENSQRFFGVDNLKSINRNVDIDKQIRTEFNYEVTLLLNKVKILTKRWEEMYPTVKVIYLLPCPLRYLTVGANNKPERNIHKSIIQFCCIKEIHKRWVDMMPAIPVISLLDVLVTDEQQESFVDGSLKLKWNQQETLSRLGEDLQEEFCQRIWQKIEGIHRLLKNNPALIEKDNSMMNKKLTKIDIHKTIPDCNKNSYWHYFFMFKTKKSKELTSLCINPYHYDFFQEWANLWFKNPSLEKISQALGAPHVRLSAKSEDKTQHSLSLSASLNPAMLPSASVKTPLLTKMQPKSFERDLPNLENQNASKKFKGASADNLSESTLGSQPKTFNASADWTVMKGNVKPKTNASKPSFEALQKGFEKPGIKGKTLQEYMVSQADAKRKRDQEAQRISQSAANSSVGDSNQQIKLGASNKDQSFDRFSKAAVLPPHSKGGDKARTSLLPMPPGQGLLATPSSLLPTPALPPFLCEASKIMEPDENKKQSFIKSSVRGPIELNDFYNPNPIVSKANAPNANVPNTIVPNANASNTNANAQPMTFEEMSKWDQHKHSPPQKSSQISNLPKPDLGKPGIKGKTLQDYIKSQAMAKEQRDNEAHAIARKASTPNSKVANTNVQNTNVQNANVQNTIVSNANTPNANVPNANVPNAKASNFNVTSANARPMSIGEMSKWDQHKDSKPQRSSQISNLQKPEIGKPGIKGKTLQDYIKSQAVAKEQRDKEAHAIANRFSEKVTSSVPSASSNTIKSFSNGSGRWNNSPSAHTPKFGAEWTPVQPKMDSNQKPTGKRSSSHFEQQNMAKKFRDSYDTSTNNDQSPSSYGMGEKASMKVDDFSNYGRYQFGNKQKMNDGMSVAEDYSRTVVRGSQLPSLFDNASRWDRNMGPVDGFRDTGVRNSREEDKGFNDHSFGNIQNEFAKTTGDAKSVLNYIGAQSEAKKKMDIEAHAPAIANMNKRVVDPKVSNQWQNFSSKRGNFSSLNALLIGPCMGDETLLDLAIPRVRYLNCLTFRNPFNPAAYEQMVLSAINSSYMGEIDILILTPFDWIINMDIGKGTMDISTPALREKNKMNLIEKIRALLTNIKALQLEMVKYYPKMKVISLLPYPVDYHRCGMGKKKMIYRSIIQYCTIMEVYKQWLEYIPDIPVISLLNLVIKKDERSFLDGCGQLKWDYIVSKELYEEISPKFHSSFWQAVQRMVTILNDDPTRMKLENVALHAKLSGNIVSEKDKEDYSSFYYKELQKFINYKSEELMDAGINPGIYDFDLEWTYQWHYVVKPRRLGGGNSFSSKEIALQNPSFALQRGNPASRSNEENFDRSNSFDYNHRVQYNRGNDHSSFDSKTPANNRMAEINLPKPPNLPIMPSASRPDVSNQFSRQYVGNLQSKDGYTQSGSIECSSNFRDTQFSNESMDPTNLHTKDSQSRDSESNLKSYGRSQTSMDPSQRSIDTQSLYGKERNAPYTQLGSSDSNVNDYRRNPCSDQHFGDMPYQSMVRSKIQGRDGMQSHNLDTGNVANEYKRNQAIESNFGNRQIQSIGQTDVGGRDRNFDYTAVLQRNTESENNKFSKGNVGSMGYRAVEESNLNRGVENVGYAKQQHSESGISDYANSLYTQRSIEHKEYQRRDPSNSYGKEENLRYSQQSRDKYDYSKSSGRNSGSMDYQSIDQHYPYESNEKRDSSNFKKVSNSNLNSFGNVDFSDIGKQATSQSNLTGKDESAGYAQQYNSRSDESNSRDNQSYDINIGNQQYQAMGQQNVDTSDTYSGYAQAKTSQVTSEHYGRNDKLELPPSNFGYKSMELENIPAKDGYSVSAQIPQALSVDKKAREDQSLAMATYTISQDKSYDSAYQYSGYHYPQNSSNYATAQLSNIEANTYNTENSATKNVTDYSTNSTSGYYDKPKYSTAQPSIAVSDAYNNAKSVSKSVTDYSTMSPLGHYNEPNYSTAQSSNTVSEAYNNENSTSKSATDYLAQSTSGYYSWGQN